MDRKIRVVQYGAGKMSRYLMRYVIEHDGELVGAFCRNKGHIGKDVAEIIGDGFPHVGVVVENSADADRRIAELKPDVCIIATRSTVAELEAIFTICAKHGVNAITTCEEALYPWNSSPALTAKLDKLAKEGGCTLTGVGYCGLYWGTMVTNLAGSSHKITKIEGSSWYNVEDYGVALAEGHGAGLSIDEFNKTIGCYNDTPSDEMKELVESGKYVPSYMWNQNGWLCSKMGLHVTSQTQKCIPCVDREDLKSETLGMVVKAGDATGMRAVVTTETKEGITLVTECVGKIYNPEETDKNVWTLHGEPNTTCIVNEPATVELTCATLVNRIPQLIDAPAGYVTTDRFPYNEYMVHPMNTYVKTK